jgi:hypothetical protein
MVIEKIFLRRASNLAFKFLAFLQLWYPLCHRQKDKERVDGMIRLYWKRRAVFPRGLVAELRIPMGHFAFLFCVGVFVLLPQQTPFLFYDFLLNFVRMLALYL